LYFSLEVFDAEITASSVDGPSGKVTVVGNLVPVEGLSLTPNPLRIAAGSTGFFAVTYNPANKDVILYFYMYKNGNWSAGSVALTAGQVSTTEGVFLNHGIHSAVIPAKRLVVFRPQFLYYRSKYCNFLGGFVMDRFEDARAVEENEEDEQDEASKEAGPDPLIQKMLKTRTILLSGEIKKDLAERTIRQLLLLEDMGEDPIRVFIDSPGGDADAGYAIFDMIRFVKPQVWTIGMGLVASAAAIIQLASPREHRVGLPNSHYLIHQPLSGIRGVATDIEIHARELDKLREKINRLIADETGAPFDQVEKDTDRDYWMNAEEAASYGLISRIVTRRDEL
jgi:ATP-dependent Clp protease protease subunit